MKCTLEEGDGDEEKSKRHRADHDRFVRSYSAQTIFINSQGNAYRCSAGPSFYAVPVLRPPLPVRPLTFPWLATPPTTLKIGAVA